MFATGSAKPTRFPYGARITSCSARRLGLLDIVSLAGQHSRPPSIVVFAHLIAAGARPWWERPRRAASRTCAQSLRMNGADFFLRS